VGREATEDTGPTGDVENARSPDDDESVEGAFGEPAPEGRIEVLGVRRGGRLIVVRSAVSVTDADTGGSPA
jgi:hypothetical protein